MFACNSCMKLIHEVTFCVQTFNYKLKNIMLNVKVNSLKSKTGLLDLCTESFGVPYRISTSGVCLISLPCECSLAELKGSCKLLPLPVTECRDRHDYYRGFAALNNAK